MSDLFYTGQRKNHASGPLSLSMEGGAELAKKLRKLEKGGEVAIQRTVSDFTSRAPGWVSKGIREHYGVDTTAIKEAGPKKRRGGASVRVAGKNVDGAALEYRGRTLTPLHFKMAPKSAPTARQGTPILIPGQLIAGAGDVATIRPPKKYTVKATIIKGKRASLPDGTFLAPVSGMNTLPFQKSGTGRGPIDAVRTLSVPQMIDGRARETIESTINEKLGGRLAHHIKQATK